MLSAEANAYLTQVGAAEPMGKLLRCYWQSILLSSELPEPDGKPVKVRALGEDLVAFRNGEGKIGLLGALCPYKSAPLYFGRNEDCGLRCVYHGWKFDLESNCVDMPNVPPESNYKDKIQQTAYPVVEANGFIFAYMGPGEPPPMPDLGFLNVLPEHIYVTKQKLECNWVQAMQGDFDPSHIGFLHSSNASHFEDEDAMDLSVQISAGVSVRNTVEEWKEKEKLGRKDRRPLILVVNTEYGLLLGGRRDPGPSVDEYMNQLIVPFYAFVPGVVGAPNHCNAWVPMDERTTMVYRIQYLRERPFNDAEKAELGNGKGAHVKVGGICRRPPNPAAPGFRRTTGTTTMAGHLRRSVIPTMPLSKACGSRIAQRPKVWARL